ncbi:MAG: phosphatidate cytidylyltransferase [Oscillospiraceae bacterium]|nr:phosphatidate cytidylyltransferase [Oscillospiraceae bacterium]
MFKRVMVAVVFIPVIFLVLFWCPPIVLPVAVSALSAIAIHEILWSTGCVKHFRISLYSGVLGALIPFWVHFEGGTSVALLGLFVYVVLLFCEAIASKKTVTLEKMGSAFFVSVMIPFFLSSFIRIRAMDLGAYYVMLPFLAAFTSDAFALFAGMLFGKHKLAPELSPKKTIEGAIGGFAGAIVGCCLYGLVIQLGWQMKPDYAVLGFFGALGSVVSQLGDLSFSYIKREYKIKDYGNIFPGHGGVLDRFDSVIFCAPLTEMLLLLLPFFRAA